MPVDHVLSPFATSRQLFVGLCVSSAKREIETMALASLKILTSRVAAYHKDLFINRCVLSASTFLQTETIQNVHEVRWFYVKFCIFLLGGESYRMLAIEFKKLGQDCVGVYGSTICQAECGRLRYMPVLVGLMCGLPSVQWIRSNSMSYWEMEDGCMANIFCIVDDEVWPEQSTRRRLTNCLDTSNISNIHQQRCCSIIE